MVPEKISEGGLIILRDGDPGEPEHALSGFGSTYYQHAVEVEVCLEEGDAAARDAAFDDPAAADRGPTLKGLAFDLTRPPRDLDRGRAGCAGDQERQACCRGRL